MTVDVETEITIDRPVETVAAFAADPSHAPEWYENIESVEWRSEPPAAVGSRIAFVATFLGRRLAYLERIFDVGYQVDRARTSGSAGLGLAIARGFVEAHHGDITAANENGGARVTVRLPRAPVT